jgi:hypothetical protein
MQGPWGADVTQRNEEDESKDIEWGKVRKDSIALDPFDCFDHFLK